MIGLEATDYFVLAFLPLALAPFAFSAFRTSVIPSLFVVPSDALSRAISRGLKFLGAVAIAASVAGAARPFLPGVDVQKFGDGAQIVMLFDRSGSMNETFAGRTPSGGEESKAAASKRILRRFVNARRHDLVGVALFSTAPMLATPLGDHPAATEAAIDAIDRPGLDYTNIARGLAMALAMFKEGNAYTSRAIVLMSDGAGVIDPKMQDDLRAEFKKMNVDLYWIFLRTAGSPGIYDRPDPAADTPQASPERHLDLFFRTLGVSYRAFEAEGPEATEEAVRQIDRVARHPMSYFERLPRTDLTRIVFFIGLVAGALLLAAKLFEVRLPTGKA
jgi:mxaC protein